MASLRRTRLHADRPQRRARTGDPRAVGHPRTGHAWSGGTPLGGYTARGPDAARWFAFPQPLTYCELLRELSHPESSLRHQLEWCPGAHMKSSPQDPIQRPRGRRNPLLRSDFSGSGKTREQGAAEGREGAKSRVRPRPPLPKTRQHGAAPENAFTVAPESAQDVSTALAYCRFGSRN